MTDLIQPNMAQIAAARGSQAEPPQAAPGGSRQRFVQQLQQGRSVYAPPGSVILVRHGEVYNPRNIYYGRMPGYYLSEQGVAEARRTGNYVAGLVNAGNLDIGAVYSSPMLRARQTATIIAQHLMPTLPVSIAGDLLEVRSGNEGRPLPDLLAEGFDFYTHPARADDERLEQLLARVLRFIRHALRRNPHKTSIGVSHGDPIAIALAFFKNYEVAVSSMRPPHSYPQHAAVTRLDFPNGFTLDAHAMRLSYIEPPVSDGSRGPGE